MSTAEILAELEAAERHGEVWHASEAVLKNRLLVWDGGCGSVGNEWEPVRTPAYRITPAGSFALEAWRLPPP